ncbi:dipeptide/oligopeptide/nickel ABC transporter permease/ATP-binding protein [Microbacterium aurantiacum]|uniref:Dipeptide/oligopeptide/nickel ABC transporter permease/ATP-binding protein n=1 Tax=Microbacterium aurantiacum TaxID=162393 RepID=A0AAJ2LYL7_9MICO|nr:dipeptide/oligopeptide/nickel ABC transporter permease/ATP-binding protein [Microbacterium aurantiacum]MDS0244389.1 dipeptide/oligopeptide/nickel ABC transporter permease/ATP-binding protein [Microbacterium aurantiacum]
MTTTSIPTPPAPRGSIAARMLRNPLGVIAASFLLLVLLVAAIGPFLVPFDPTKSVLANVFLPPGTEYLLGGDSAGRDVLSRLVVATSVSLAGATITVVVAALLGIPAGLIAGYRGGWADSIIAWAAGLLLALPGIVVLLAARAVIGPSMWTIMAIFGVIVAPSYYRVVFNAVRAVREELYIDAARVAGLSDWRIIGRHVLTAVRAPAILLTSGVFAVGIGIQATLDFLGLGDPSLPTWGGMLSEGFYNIFRAPTLLIWPTVAIALTCIAFTLFGTALRDELELAGDKVRRASAGWVEPDVRPEPPIVHAESPDTASAPLLDVSDLSVAYPVEGGWKTVVDAISLRIRPGEVHALIGESGSGKTQTAWSILGLLPQGGTVVSGSIVFEDTQLAGADAATLAGLRGHRIGYVPQEPLSNLDPSYTVGHQLVEPMRVVLGLPRGEAKARALELLRKVGIPDPARTFRAYPHEISGGMAQRVLIAGAIACEPSLIIADEPTTALDVTVQAEILELLRHAQRETGAAMLLVTHNFGVVADLADRVSVMRTGTIVETGPVLAVFDEPRHPYTRALFGALLDDAPPREDLTTSEVSR